MSYSFKNKKKKRKKGHQAYLLILGYNWIEHFSDVCHFKSHFFLFFMTLRCWLIDWILLRACQVICFTSASCIKSFLDLGRTRALLASLPFLKGYIWPCTTQVSSLDNWGECVFCLWFAFKKNKQKQSRRKFANKFRIRSFSLRSFYINFYEIVNSTVKKWFWLFIV